MSEKKPDDAGTSAAEDSRPAGATGIAHQADPADDRAPGVSAGVKPDATTGSATVPRLSAPPGRPPEKTSRRGAGALAWLALLIALVALAGSGYLWLQQRQVGARLASANTALDTASAAIDEAVGAVQALSADLRRTGDRISKLEAAQNSVDDLRGSLAADINRNAGEIKRIENSLASMRGLSDTVRETWVRAETEYFLQSANTALQISRDPDSAQAALEAADDRLRALADPALTEVRAQLAREIAAVRAIPRADIQGIALSLGSLSARVDLLPVAGGEQRARFVDESAREVSGESRWQRALSAVGGALKGLVSVQRRDSDIAPLLAPQERFFLYRNLELQLEMARLAALRNDSANYRESLRAARRWLDTHFDTDDAGVVSTLETLVQLESADIDPPLPDISGSLRELRRSDSGGSG